MPGKRKSHREKDLTERYLSGGMNDDHVAREQRFTSRSKHHQQNKTLRTTEKRAEALAASTDVEALPLGEVVQVFSLYADVEHDGKNFLAVVRKTLKKTSKTDVVVGDRVRFRAAESKESVIEAVEPRRTLLTRADSFKAMNNHPIVANADQMLIVASLAYPKVKWGLIDRMLIAAQAGRLSPIICLNKVDCIEEFPEEWEFAQVAPHYATIGIRGILASVEKKIGLDETRDALKDRVTVLSGHSGVGKSSLIRAIQPSLDLKIGAISNFNDKGRHTTTSARRYRLDVGGAVIDTPGVKLFGLWNVNRDNLTDFFPDMTTGTAPQWRQDSFGRIQDSLPR